MDGDDEGSYQGAETTGFQSPAQDYIEHVINLSRVLDLYPHALRWAHHRPDPHLHPAHSVRGPKHSVKKGKTSVLDADEMHDLLASIDTDSLLALRIGR